MPDIIRDVATKGHLMIGKGPATEEIWQIDYCGPASESLREDVLRPEARIGMLFGAKDTHHSPEY